MRATLAFVLAALVVGGGCLGATTDAPLDAASAEGPLAAGVPFGWLGRELDAGRSDSRDEDGALVTCIALGDCPPARTTCEPTNCERTVVTVPGEAPFDGSLVVGLRWPTSDVPWLALWIEDASGRMVAEGRSITIDHAGASAILERPSPGAYTIVVAAAMGRADYEAAAQLVPATPTTNGPARDLLPDLVTLPPTDLRLEDPPGQFLANAVMLPTTPVANAMGAKGCALEEAMDGARRCLRFSNSIGNAGEGPLDVVLSLAEGATAPAGGRFAQRIQRSDGSVREVEAGPAEWHAIHAHWHNAGAGVFTVHPYDPATGARGDAIADGRKTGMCFADVGVLDIASPTLTLPDHQGAPCFNPAIAREWRMGLSVGWYDNYVWLLGDQYVDITSVEDGTYTLCSEANGLGFLTESNVTNNMACTPFQLTGDDVELLDPPPYHALREA